ncbi:intraflagellar transport protein 22 homolog [Cephus cinctus]|uniref:Intraflagellar transport protein 22 homolog n=1 Tax=Cephus cinctus TaxID=211228 RepID=A0AAJ7C1T8_CEPCN|nr:intraflagellar transport protein 22 homolog [Cephus cinctus]
MQLKLVIVGPLGAGKTTISNFLADATEVTSEYRPTQGVRILEFDVDGISVRNRNVKADIELWDCSGDHQFENCWPAMRKDIHGVIFVYNSKSREYTRELEQFYDYFVNQTRLGAKSCVVFYFDPDQNSLDAPKKISATFARVSQVSCNVEEGGNKLKTDFQAFLGTLISNMQEYTDQEENNIMKDNILFAK